MDRNKILHDPHHLWVPLGACKMISKPMVCSAQTVHLSWIEISTISKWTATRFHLSLITKEHNPLRPKCFLRLWYIWHKSCTYLALKLTLSPNRPKRASIWTSSPRSTIRCIQNNFWAYGTFGTNRPPILHQNLHDLQKDQKEILQDHHLRVPLGTSEMISEAMVRLVQTMDLSCTGTNTISK
jgi:hypothetical protein